MSNVTDHADEFKEIPGFLLSKAVEDVSQQGYAQIKALQEEQKTLSSLQVTLSDVEKKGEAAEQELRSKDREILMLEGKLEHLERQAEVLRDRCGSINKENTKLQFLISEEQEDARLSLEKFNIYRNKMEGHRVAVLYAASQTEAHKELEEKREMVQVLRQKKEQLREDLEDPNGNTVQMAKKETDALRRQISERRTRITDQKEKLRKEFEVYSQLEKDIEIQNRRHEAIVRRLCCQLSRARAAHRQMSDEIYHLQRQLAEIKGQPQSSQDSVVSDN